VAGVANGENGEGSGVIEAAKKLVKRVLYRPRLGALGANSLVLSPRKLLNPERIFVGRDVIIYGHSIIFPLAEYQAQSFESRIMVGDDCYIGKFAQLHAIDRIELGRGCVLSEYVYISDNAHGFDPKAGLIMKQNLESKGPVVLGENCFLGFGVRVMPGVTLGDWCVVGTGSVVTKSFPAYSMIAGVPARLVKQYRPETGDWVRADGVVERVA
jgi:acetyltransferase-like isoleucine patch superfamily enzyme